MREFRAASVDDTDARELLAEYVEYRIATFPSGRYRASMPDAAVFTPPAGEFVIVDVAGAAAGCGGIRDLGDGRWEVKHLWMRPAVRGGGHGRALLSELERRAIARGATELVLDTNDSLVAAGALYASAGFERIEPYNDNPNATAWYHKAVR
jgi:ribosomal protein S18 acetylase RimI-like enzyme